MKTMIISTLFLLFLQMALFSQNRICGWDTEKITAIEVEYSFPDHEKEAYLFNASDDMDRIISFLKNVDFRELNSSNLDSLEENHPCAYRISFQGQRDQVYLYKHSACIGKTSFLINQDVIRDFEILIKLMTGKSGLTDAPGFPIIASNKIHWF